MAIWVVYLFIKFETNELTSLNKAVEIYLADFMSILGDIISRALLTVLSI